MKKKFLAVLTAFALATPFAQAGSDYLLELDGVKGESKDSVHQGAIEIESFSWGVSNAGSMASGSGGGVGKASFSDLHFTTSVGKASPILMMACATGQHIRSAKLFVRKTGSTDEYLVITLTDVLLSSYSSSGRGTSNPPGGSSASSSVPVESISINFTKVEMKYTSEDGTTTTGSAELPPAPPAQ